MAATARVIVMMEEDEKASLEARAQAEKVSTAEFVRRRLFGRGAPEEEAFLQMLAALNPLVRAACKTIDGNLTEIRVLRESSDDRDARVAEHARRELTRAELRSIVDRFHLEPTPRSVPRRRGARP